MHPATLKRVACSPILRQVSLTFYTKDTCQLCKNAGAILNKTLQSKDFQGIGLTTIDIMAPENSSAFDKYCYDVPVLHVDRPGQRKPVKFMHYFDEEKLAAEFRRNPQEA